MNEPRSNVYDVAIADYTGPIASYSDASRTDASTMRVISAATISEATSLTTSYGTISESTPATASEASAATISEASPATISEANIRAYVQVPNDYCDDGRWTGDWVDKIYGGQKFMSFGCGVCCLTNVYDTLTNDNITPDIMLEWCKQLTDYNPDSGRGALSWWQLKSMCNQFGASADTRNKPADYAQFQAEMSEADTILVLVCKADDDKLWWYTKGHYVNLWNYDPESDTVFVTDSSGLFNRQRVYLIDVYNALKSSSEYQYMIINSASCNCALFEYSH